jgi:8-oxo-dGTP pyrophosphatase MutT (NUDIX family)
MLSKYLCQYSRYAIILCRNRKGKFLCVKETDNRGWWLPGGKVERNETFVEAALRECREETNIKVKVKGIIRVDNGEDVGIRSFRCIFYAEPLGEDQSVKRVPDG